MVFFCSYPQKPRRKFLIIFSEPKNKVSARYVSFLKLLLSNGAHVIQADNEGSTALRLDH